MTRSSTSTLSALAKCSLVLGICFGEGKRIPAELQAARGPPGLAITNRCRIGKKQKGLRSTSPLLLRELRHSAAENPVEGHGIYFCVLPFAVCREEYKVHARCILVR